MKKIFILIIFIFCCLTVCGCSHEDISNIDQDKVDEVIYYIDDLPSNIKLSHKDTVDYIMGMYNELNDEEKNLVTNYLKLYQANRKIKVLEDEDNLIKDVLKASVE